MLRKFLYILVFLFSLLGCTQQNSTTDKQTTETIRKEVLNHGAQIREAFLQGDLEKIRSLHHPDVQKALAYNDLKNGREEAIQALKGLLENYTLEFVENNVENILIRGDLAIEQTRFVIKGTPKKEGDAFVFKGRTSVTYVRYADSPSGWATLHEIIQPYTE